MTQIKLANIGTLDLEDDFFALLQSHATAKNSSLASYLQNGLLKLVGKRQTKKDPTYMTEEEVVTMVQEAEEEYKAGKYIRISSHEELDTFLNSL